jgi:hypothetical protein
MEAYLCQVHNHPAKSFGMLTSEKRRILHYGAANKSFRFRTYRLPSGKSLRIRTYGNTGGRGKLNADPFIR